MNYLVTLVAFGAFFFLMAVGLIFAGKMLKKGCSTDPGSCPCRREGRDPSECEQK